MRCLHIEEPDDHPVHTMPESRAVLFTLSKSITGPSEPIDITMPRRDKVFPGDFIANAHRQGFTGRFLGVEST